MGELGFWGCDTTLGVVLWGVVTGAGSSCNLCVACRVWGVQEGVGGWGCQERMQEKGEGLLEGMVVGGSD